MLAFLVEGLQGVSPQAVLAVDGDVLLEMSGLGKFLPRGRLNGISNVLETIKQQVRARLGNSSPHDTPHDTPVQENKKLETQASPILGHEPPSQINDLGILGKGYGTHSGKEEIAVLLSGGVDSSVALQLLKQQGYSVRAFYLKIWLEDELAHLGTCPWEEDWAYASAVAKQLDVPLEAVSLQREYWDQVVSYLISEAQEGRTPNPDIMCNSRIKFGMFYDHVGKNFEKIATGHYAQVQPVQGDIEEGHKPRVRLVRSPDAIKDQTYFLCNMRQEQLQHAMFPIGHLQKHEVRQLAEDFQLPTQSRKDSQGICFLGKLKFEDFISHHLGEKEGPVVDYLSGRELGRHQGLWYHTTGQRKGLGKAVARFVHEGPWYVVGKDVKTNTLLVTNKYELVDTPRSKFHIKNINWITDHPLVASGDGSCLDLQVKVRHGSGMHSSKICLEEEGRSAWAHLAEKDAGLAPGQYAAMYLGDECLGAGVISDESFL